MVSQRKLEANRANARKSTGPKSAEGKKRASRNAITHGLLSNQFPVLPFEDENEYRNFADAVTRDYQPLGIVQREVVGHIALTLWKLRRIPAIECALLEGDLAMYREQLEDQVDDGDEEAQEILDLLGHTTSAGLIAAQFVRKDEQPFERYELYHHRLQRSLHNAMRQLTKLRSETAGEELSDQQRARYTQADADLTTGDPPVSSDSKEHGQVARDTKGASELPGTNEPNSALKPSTSRKLHAAVNRAVDPKLYNREDAIKLLGEPQPGKVWPYWKHPVFQKK